MKKNHNKRIRAILRRKRKTLTHLRRVENERMQELMSRPESDVLDRVALDVDLETMERVKEMEYRRLLEVTRSLARLGGGGYFRCAVCRRVIDPRRLEAVPETTVCIRCARAAEQQGWVDTEENEVAIPAPRWNRNGSGAGLQAHGGR